MVDGVPRGGRGKKLTVLARLVKQHPAQLRADFQQFYGLNLDGMGTDYSVLHAADLAAQLPQESRCVAVESQPASWTRSERLLALIEYYAHAWVWAHSEDAKKKRNVPELRIPTSQREEPDIGGLVDFMESLIEKEGDAE